MSLLSKNEIEQLLKWNFNSLIRKRGYNYYKIGRVRKLKINKNKIVAAVKGSARQPYQVTITKNKLAHSAITNCNCPYGNGCKHVAATLYYLLHSGTKTRPKKVITKKKFEEKQAGQWRHLEMAGNMVSTITHYSTRSNDGQMWNQKIESVINENQEIEMSLSATYSYVSQDKAKILLKEEDGLIYVKCQTCNESTSQLCSHQTKILKNEAPALDVAGVGEKTFRINAVLSKAAADLDVPLKNLHKYYRFVFTPKGIAAVSQDNVMSDTWLSEINLLYGNSNHIDLNTITVETKDSRPPRYAFNWRIEQDMFPYLSFIKGKAYKNNKEGMMKTERELSELPYILPDRYQPLAKEMMLISLDTDEKRRFEEVRASIMNNLDTINSIYHYIEDNSKYGWHKRGPDSEIFQFSNLPFSCSFKCKREDNFIHITRKVSIGAEKVVFEEAMYPNILFSIFDDTAHLHPNYNFKELMGMFGDHDTIIFRSDPQHLVQLVYNLSRDYEVDMPEDILPIQKTLTDPEHKLYLHEEDKTIVFEPSIHYDELQFNPLQDYPYHVDEYLFTPAAEDIAFINNFLSRAHPLFEEMVRNGETPRLSFAELLNDKWFIAFSESCEAVGIELIGIKELSSFKYSALRPSTITHVNSGIDWFDIKMELKYGRESIPTPQWIRAIKNKQTYVTLKDGSLGILPEQWIKQVEKIIAVADINGSDIAISKYRFNIIDELFTEVEYKDVVEEIEERKQKLFNYNFEKKYELPISIQGELRDYQVHGYQWLRFLDANDLGGILADDMGLGKTLQIICLLASQENEKPSLVIVPRTLLFNWGAELDKFCPSLNYIIHHGTARDRELEGYNNVDIIISTYGTVVNDIENIKEKNFNYIILDESQAIKNPHSKRYKAVRLLQSRNKLTMTGTPIENNTMDLYAQLSFATPGLLGSQNSFKSKFAIPIDNHRDADRAALLRKMIHPFVLRRTKSQVAQELPDKIESIIYCEMAEAQRKLYTNLKEKVREDVHKAVESEGLAKSKFYMLDGLLRLRQMCNSPLLVNDSFKGLSAESVKIKMLLNNIQENVKEHSVLIFSQFVKLLAIVKSELDRLEIAYAYLDGSTRKRKEEVDRFMNNDEVRVFLISIKAGNTGMNLTKADYVYILDPWWNPAVEAQAIDRTHRIGQDKHVFAYRMICKNTIEEKILELQDRKKAISQDLISVDENVIKSLNKDELLALFD